MTQFSTNHTREHCLHLDFANERQVGHVYILCARFDSLKLALIALQGSKHIVMVFNCNYTLIRVYMPIF